MTSVPPLFGPESTRTRSVTAFSDIEQRIDTLLVDLDQQRAGRPRRIPEAARAPLAVAAGIVALLGVSLLATPSPQPLPEVVEPVAAAPLPPVEEEVLPEPVTPEVVVEPSAPAVLRIETIGIEAPVVPVGLEPGGAMEIPDDVREVGWYDPDDLGVRPGTQGTAVFASHVDSRTQGRGVLFELRQMRTGDTFLIDLEDGTAQTWIVTEVAQIPKVSMPLGEIFTWAGPPRVVIITCGGEFDRSARSYVDNIVVYAEPLDPPSV